MEFFDPEYLETVYATLFTLLQSTVLPTTNGLPAAFVSSQRVSWFSSVPTDISPADQPALLMVSGPMKADQGKLFGPTKWTLTAAAIIYMQGDGSTNPGAPLAITQANEIIWAVSNKLSYPTYQKQTLNGLVYHAWIEGEIHPEIFNQQVVITIPMYILPGPGGGPG
jgi:hypothetical protein